MEARSAAALAAKSQGLSVGAWLDRVVRYAASETLRRAPRQERIDPTNEDAVRALAREMVEMKTNMEKIGSSLNQIVARQPGFLLSDDIAPATKRKKRIDRS